VRSTVTLARSLGITTLADGVDSSELLDQLASYGCRGVQGGIAGAPIAPAALPLWLGGIRLDEDRVPTG
jgi:EAL domain-containing protein (putative c-di-GMP-specific phosphodiesterase class I)